MHIGLNAELTSLENIWQNRNFDNDVVEQTALMRTVGIIDKLSNL